MCEVRLRQLNLFKGSGAVATEQCFSSIWCSCGRQSIKGSGSFVAGFFFEGHSAVVVGNALRAAVQLRQVFS